MALPTAAQVVPRLQNANPAVATALTTNYGPIVTVALANIASTTGLAIPHASITNERIVHSGKGDWLVQKRWPVSLIRKASIYGTIPLRIGSETDLFSGVADIAIGEGGKILELAPGLGGPDMQGVSVFVDYDAGFQDDTLPDDLMEVLVQLCFLIAQETAGAGRVGTTSIHIGEGTISITRKLPPWAQRILNNYRRMYVYV